MKKGMDSPLYKPLVHGTEAGYKKNCRCRKCKDAHAENKREVRARLIK
jgi:hypothetical protein